MLETENPSQAPFGFGGKQTSTLSRPYQRRNSNGCALCILVSQQGYFGSETGPHFVPIILISKSAELLKMMGTK